MYFDHFLYFEVFPVGKTSHTEIFKSLWHNSQFLHILLFGTLYIFFNLQRDVWLNIVLYMFQNHFINTWKSVKKWKIYFLPSTSRQSKMQLLFVKTFSLLLCWARIPEVLYLRRCHEQFNNGLDCRAIIAPNYCHFYNMIERQICLRAI